MVTYMPSPSSLNGSQIFENIFNTLKTPINTHSITKFYHSSHKAEALRGIWYRVLNLSWNCGFDASPTPSILADSLNVTQTSQALFARKSTISAAANTPKR